MCLVCIINAEEQREQNVSASQTIVATVSTSVDGVYDCDVYCSETNYSPPPQSAVYYFAIGSMTNHISLQLRELKPISSQPAILDGYRLLFRGSGGMASAEEVNTVELIDDLDDNSSKFETHIHGVLHLLTHEQLKLLDTFEGGYIRKPCKVTLYDNCTRVNAYVYSMDRKKWKLPHQLPTERYLDIITKGCTFHGVNKEWVEYIKSLKTIPRKEPIDFTSFTMQTAVVPILSWDEIKINNGDNEQKRLWIVINNKVLEFCGDVYSFFPFGYFVKHQIGGTDYTLRFAKAFYEPKYYMTADMSCSAELEVEHRAWIEDQFCCPPPALASSKWTVVGVVNNDFIRNFGIRKVMHVPSSNTPINFYRDICNGYNQFFITGDTASNWIICDGIYVGQSLYIRKTATRNYAQEVNVIIKHQDLTNRVSSTYVFATDKYSLSFVWDGHLWFLEYSQ